MFSNILDIHFLIIVSYYFIYIYIYTYKIRNHAVRTIRKRWQHSSLEQRNFDIRELLDGASDGSANVWQQRLASCRIVGPRERFRVGIEKKVRYVSEWVRRWKIVASRFPTERKSEENHRSSGSLAQRGSWRKTLTHRNAWRRVPLRDMMNLDWCGVAPCKLRRATEKNYPAAI